MVWRHFVVAVSVAAVACACHPGPVAAKAPPVSIGPGAPMVSDSVRYAAVPLGSGRVRVFDDRRGTSFDLEQPTGCAGDGQWPSGDVAAIGGGVLVWNCEGPNYGWDRPRLVSLRTRTPVAAATGVLDR